MSEMERLTTVDYLVVVAYLVIMITVGVLMSRWNKDADDYFKGGNKLPYWLAGLSQEEFKETFRGNPVKRAKWRGLLRNTLIAMGNSGNPAFRPVLEKFAATEDALLAEHARWALKQFSG